jgi:hypothetical protein
VALNAGERKGISCILPLRSIGKKGIFFTLISIMIIIMFIFYFKTQSDLMIKQKTDVVRERVINLNNFVESFEQTYAPRALYAISHRALGAYISCINDTNKAVLPGNPKVFSSNISADFQSLVLEGDLAAPIYPIVPSCSGILPDMQGNTLQDWFTELTKVSRNEMNVNFSFKVNGISLEQDYETGPWKARAQMDIDYGIISEGIANWTRNSTINVTFDVQGFTDPYIEVMSDGYLTRQINITNVTSDRITTLDQFKSLINGGAYMFENRTAPSFLMRFEGNTSSSGCCGIESFVTPIQIYGDAGDTDVYGRSYIDFEFWSKKCFHERTLSQEHTLWNGVRYMEVHNSNIRIDPVCSLI